MSSCQFVVAFSDFLKGYLVVLGGPWWFLVVLVVFGSSWWLLLVLIGSWWFLVVLGGSWCFFVVLYISCFFLFVLGSSWSFFVFLGVSLVVLMKMMMPMVTKVVLFSCSNQEKHINQTIMCKLYFFPLNLPLVLVSL